MNETTVLIIVAGVIVITLIVIKMRSDQAQKALELQSRIIALENEEDNPQVVVVRDQPYRWMYPSFMRHRGGRRHHH